MMWPGSDFEYQGKLSTYVQKYNRSMPWNDRVDKIMSWIKDDNKPANLVFAYFEEPDRTCHSVGVESQETINQIVKADVTVKYLLDQIKCENLEKKLNLIILSDHGMESITYDHIIFLESYASNMTYKMIVTGPNAFVYPNPGKFDEVYANFTKAAESGTFNVYKQDQIPERWHFKNSPRLKGLIYLLAEPSYMFWYDILNITAKDEFKVGTHGYDNANERMNTIFMASGPAFKSNYTAEPFESVDVYPLLSHVAGLKTPGTAGARPCNGTMDTVRHMLRQDAPSAAVRPPSRRRSQGVWAAVLLHAAVATVTRCL
ncbi:Hypothetical protein CINCED_3A020487 [Cinara cedri]|nr:Hypothetical protein CINCED_3A020487 [Cinara cedri]